MEPYVADQSPRTVSRLNPISGAASVKTMWGAVAKYRFVDIVLQWNVTNFGNPEVCAVQLVQAASLLMKGWEKDAMQPTAVVPHTVTIDLGSLFNETMPFNVTNEWFYSKDIVSWALTNLTLPLPFLGFQRLAATSTQYLTKLITIIGRHRGSTDWAIVAVTELDEKNKGGASCLEELRTHCSVEGVQFRNLTQEELAYD
jgi:hypothetical protein